MKIPDYVMKIMWENGGKVGRGGIDAMVERVLELGDDKQVDWVLANYSRDKMALIVKQSKKVSVKSANYWAKYLDISWEEVECLRKHWPNRQDRFGKN